MNGSSLGSSATHRGTILYLFSFSFLFFSFSSFRNVVLVCFSISQAWVKHNGEWWKMDDSSKAVPHFSGSKSV